MTPPPVPPNNHDDDDDAERRRQAHRDGYSDDERAELARQAREIREQRREQRRERDQRDAVDVSYGGLNLVARGSIVVLVILIAGQSVFTLLTYSWLNIKIQNVVDPQNIEIAAIRQGIAENRGQGIAEMRSLRDDIVRNRDYLRELGRTCLLTEQQKMKFQGNLSPAMKELLMREYLVPNQNEK